MQFKEPHGLARKRALPVLRNRDQIPGDLDRRVAQHKVEYPDTRIRAQHNPSTTLAVAAASLIDPPERSEIVEDDIDGAMRVLRRSRRSMDAVHQAVGGTSIVGEADEFAMGYAVQGLAAMWDSRRRRMTCFKMPGNG